VFSGDPRRGRGLRTATRSIAQKRERQRHRKGQGGKGEKPLGKEEFGGKRGAVKKAWKDARRTSAKTNRGEIIGGTCKLYSRTVRIKDGGED